MVANLEGVSTARKTSSKRKRVDSYNRDAWTLRRRDPSRAQALAEDAAALAEKAGGRGRSYAFGTAESQSIQAYLACQRCEYDEAQRLAKAALKVFDLQGRPEQRLRALHILFVAHRKQGAGSAALEQAIAALEIAEDLGDRAAQARSLSDIGTVYGDMEKPAEALRYFERALGHFEALDDRVNEVLVLNNISHLQMALDQPDAALTTAERALAIAESAGDAPSCATVLGGLGEIHEAAGRMDEALESYERALKTFRELEAPYPQLYLLRNIGRLKRRAGELGAALQALEESFSVAESAAAPADLASIHLELSRVHEALGQSEPALKHHKAFHDRFAEAQAAAKERAMDRLETRFRAEASQREAEIFREKNVELEATVAARTRDLSEMLGRTEAVYRVARATSHYPDVPSLLRSVAALAMDHLAADHVYLATLDHQAECIDDEVWEGHELSHAIEANYQSLQRGLTGWVLRRLEPVRLPKLSRDPRLSSGYAKFEAAGGGSVIVAPLHFQGRGIGILLTGRSRDAEDFDQADLDLCEAIGNQLSLALEHAALADQERRLLRQIVDAVPEGVTIFERREPRQILWANRAACQTLGRPAEKLIGSSISTFLEGVLEPDVARIAAALREKGHLRNMVIQHQRRDGQRIWGRLSITPIELEGKQALLSTFVDIEKQKKAEAQLHQLEVERLKAMYEAEQRRLEHQQTINTKLREVDRLKSSMLRNMSHEIRTPLNSILGFSQILAEDVDDPELRNLADMIDLSGRRLMETLNSVLDLAQLESQTLTLKPAPVDLGRLVQESIALLRPRAQAVGLGLTLSLDDERPVIAATDQTALIRVLDNLLDNAFRFTPEGEIRVRVGRDGARALLAVSDTGIGIGEAFLPHLFEPFRQESSGSDRTYEGIGLGLSLVKLLVDHMGGSVEVTSTKDVGSTFTIFLPLWTGTPNLIEASGSNAEAAD